MAQTPALLGMYMAQTGEEDGGGCFNQEKLI